MLQRFRELYRGAVPFKAAVLAVCAVLYLGAVCWAGGSVFAMLKLCGAVVLYILLPGMLCERLLYFRARPHRQEEFSQARWCLRILLGTGVLCVIYCVAMRLHCLWALRLLPPVLGLGFLTGELTRRKGRLPCFRHTPSPAQWGVLLLFAALVFFTIFTNVIKYARPSSAGDVLIDQDFLYFVGNAKSFQLAFPSIEIRFYNVRFQYHYLTEMLCGILGLITGVDCYDILAFYQQPFLLAGMLLCLWELAGIFYHGNERKRILFLASLFGFGCASLWLILPNGNSAVGNSSIRHMLTNVTSMTTAVMYFSIFASVFVLSARKAFRVEWRFCAVLVCSFVMLTVAKGPVALLCGLAVVATLLFLLPRRQVGAQGLLTVAVGGGVFWVLYGMLFSASTNGSMNFYLLETVKRFVLADIASAAEKLPAALFYPCVVLLWLAQLALMIPGLFIPLLSSVWQDIRSLFKLPPERLFMDALAAGGILAYFLFNHPSYSQVYFFFAAVVPLHLLACGQAETLLSTGKSAWARACRLLAAGGAAVAVVTALCFYIWCGGSGLRCFLRDVGVLEKYPYPTVITADDEAAMIWLHDNTDGAATMFATNRIHSDAVHTDGISNVYTAFSGRQAFMEGYGYVADLAPWMWVNERREVNSLLFAPDTDPETLRELCARYGITHLVFSRQEPGSEEALMQTFPCVYQGCDVRIYAVLMQS